MGFRRTSPFKNVSETATYKKVIAEVEKVFDELESVEFTKEAIEKVLGNTNVGKYFDNIHTFNAGGINGFSMSSLSTAKASTTDMLKVFFTHKYSPRRAEVIRHR